MSVTSVKRWPMYVWALQLVPSLLLTFVGIMRATNAYALEDPWKTALALALGLAWSAFVVAMMAWPSGKRWLVEHRIEWCMAAASTLLAIVLLDIGLTVTGIVPTIEAQRGRSISYSLGQHTRTRLVPQDIEEDDGGVIHVNARGFRGAEIDPVKSPGSLRIVVLGGSQVFDYSGGNWPSKLQTELESSGIDVEVINAGVPGHDTSDSLGKFVTDIWTLEPDILLLCQTWNDIKWYPLIDAENPYRGLPPDAPLPWRPDWRIYPSGVDAVLVNSAIYRHFRWGFAQLLYTEEGNLARLGNYVFFGRHGQGDQSSGLEWGLRQFRINLGLMADLSRNIGADFVMCKQAKLALKDGVGESQAAARDYGLLTTGLPHEKLTEAYEASHQIIQDIATDRQLQVIDMDAAMSGRTEYFHDGVHFNPVGAQVAARLAAESIRPLLDNAP